MNDSSPETAMEPADVRMSRLLPAYAVPAGHFDELRAPDGTLRPEWNTSLVGAGSERRLLRAGAAAHRAADRRERRHLQRLRDRSTVRRGRGRSTCCRCSSRRPSGRTLERGLRQRARLLNAVAADLYGPQQLLRDGLIPPALVFRHPGFLRACHGVQAAGRRLPARRRLRSGARPDGRWRVVGTRTQAPSGAGYALENRADRVAAVSRMRTARSARPAALAVLSTCSGRRCRRPRRAAAACPTSCC